MKEKLAYFTKWLQEFSPKQTDGYIDISLPVVIYTCNGLLELRITLLDEGYEICCPQDIFCEANGSLEYYFKIFEKYDKNRHYGMGVKEGVFCKAYEEEFSLVCAVDEFVRFFVLLDDFILNNNVIGHEEEFPV